jgi:DNA-binding IscR family transcriptional regulator
VSLLDVVSIFEDGAKMRQCILRSTVCSLRSRCDVHDAWAAAQAAMAAHLASTSFQQLVDESAGASAARRRASRTRT